MTSKQVQPNTPHSSKSEANSTKENKPFKTVYVPGIPIKATKDEVKQYFERYFGKVETIDIHRKFRNLKSYHKYQFAYAHVRFKNYDAAAKAVQQKKHLFLTKRIKVFVSDSWHQKSSSSENEDNIKKPKGIDRKKQKMEALYQDLNLLRLNDFCLLHICKFLNIIDLMTLIKIGGRLKAVALTIMKKYYTQLNLTNAIANDATQQQQQPQKQQSDGEEKKYQQIDYQMVGFIFRHAGQFVKDLKLSVHNFKDIHEGYFDRIFRECIHLESVHFTGFRFTVSMVQRKLRFASIRSKLKTITFELCNRGFKEFMDLIFAPALIFPDTIETLKFINCTKFPQFCLENLKSLQTLHIEGAVGFVFELDSYLEETTIKYLTIKRKTNVPMHFLSLRCLSKLEYLNVNFNIFHRIKETEFKYLKYLKCLHLPNVTDDLYHILECLPEKNLLEELNISSSQSRYLNVVLPKFINLHTLKVSEHNSIGEYFLISLAEQLDLHHFECGTIPISDKNFVEIIKLSENLKSLLSLYIDVKAIRSIVQFLNSVGSRPKLLITGLLFMQPQSIVEAMEIQNTNKTRVELKEVQILTPAEEDLIDVSDSSDEDDDATIDFGNDYVISDSEDEYYRPR